MHPTSILPLLTRTVRMAAYQIRHRRRRAPRPVAGVLFERDVAVPMRDGLHLMANVFRPRQTGRHSPQDAEDYYDLIEWAATQPWSTGKVGLSGVSYLAMSQWSVAALNPPHLSAIMPWEGVSDMYREMAFHGGIRETGFVPAFYRQHVWANRNRAFPPAENLLDQIQSHPLDDEYWATKRPDLSRIDVPALICATWSDQGLHTRGSLEGFARISSQHKWLYTHGRRKWETFYSPEAQAVQQQFFDHFLKDLDTGILEVPPVRLEVRRAYYSQTVRSEPEWPLAHTVAHRLYLNARDGSLGDAPAPEEASVTYDSRGGGATFTFRFDRDTELTGGMRLHLWIAAEDADDADLFVGIDKLDAAGEVVGFSGYNFVANDVAAKGWLRLSHRELDDTRSTETRPWHPHRRIQKVRPGEVVAADVEILPSCTLFEAGTSFRLIVQGHELRDYPAFGHKDSVNHGRHRLFTGGSHAAYLAAPFIS
jgi:predicted acyl esterase